MKKFSFIACALFTSYASSAQRMADLELTMTQPANGLHMKATDAISFTTSVKNNGPASILTTDTLVLAFYLDNSQQPEMMVVNGQSAQTFGSTLQSPMTVGQGGTMGFTMSFANPPAQGAHTLCAVITPLNRSADSVRDNAINNNRSCATITIDFPTAIDNNELAVGDVRVYPNPASVLINFDVNTSAAAKVELVLTDMAGRIVHHQTKEGNQSGKQILQVESSNFPAGMYLYRLSAGQQTYNGKLNIAH